MKKIYFVMSAFVMSSSIFGQNALKPSMSTKEAYIKKSPKLTHQSIVTAGGAVQGRFDVGFSLISFNGVQPSEINNTNGKVGTYVDPTLCDSTVQQSFASGTSYINTMKFGTTFDPKSIIFDSNFVPLFSKQDSYVLDTVWIGSVYQRKTADTDTLLVEIVWGDTSLASTFGRWAYASPYGYYGTWTTPNYTTSNAQQGSKAYLSAPSTNKIVIKKTLTDADTTFLKTTSYLPFIIGQTIPANNIVSVNVTFIPGQSTYSVGTISYNAGAGSTTATMNGFAAVQYAQITPAQPALGADYFDDFGTNKNYSQFLSTRQRYGADGGIFNSVLRGSIASSYWIDFSVHGNSTVGVHELSKTNFGLSQNIPNPFTKESTVKYQLLKDAASAIFTVTDVMGRIISSEKVETTSGTHSVKLGAYASGLYYYSLNVDGQVSSKKMIVE